MIQTFLSALGLSPGQVSILPAEGTTGRALGLVMSIMSFLACLAIWASVSITHATSAWTSGLSQSVTVQLKPTPEGPVSQAEIDAVVELLKNEPGVAKVRVISDAESSALLEPWIGKGSVLSELPVPVLIDLTVVDRAALDIPKMQDTLKTVSLNSVIDDHTRWTAKLYSAARSLSMVTLSVVLLVLVAATAIIVFATRASLQTHADIVEILHISGAKAGFIATAFQAHFLGLGLKSGLAGLAFALSLIGLVWFGTRPGPEDLVDVGFVPRLTLTPLGLFFLCLVPLGAAGIATYTARTTVLRALSRLP